jgi:hypothetical protein
VRGNEEERLEEEKEEEDMVAAGWKRGMTSAGFSGKTYR